MDATPKIDLETLLARIRDEIEKAFEGQTINPATWGIFDSLIGLIAEDASGGDIKLISHAVSELTRAAKIFAPYRTTRKVTIFGSARIGPGHPDYETAVAFAKMITARGFMVITGAGPGIMAAGNEGAGKKRSFGVNIQLPFEQSANEFIENDPKLVHFKYFFTRKVTFVKETDALVLFPGGFGTMDEAFEALTLIQTGKSTPVPIVCVEEPGGKFWKRWDKFINENLLGRGLISPNDLNLYQIARSPEHACDVISNFYSCYHSQRWVGPNLILRFLKPIDNATLEAVNRRFSPIVTSGQIERCDMQDAEADEPQTANLHRLSLMFNRKDIALLRLLIDYINDHT